MKENIKEKKVFLGLSGGVDSAVAAYLLKEEGYHVCCGFMRNWDSYTNGDIEGNPTIKEEICSQEKDYQDALAVAQLLGLELKRIDFIKEYWDLVFADFIQQYQAGNTPNPDILCNKHIKFSAFYNYAKKNGFDYLATGHYAKLITRTGEKNALPISLQEKVAENNNQEPKEEERELQLARAEDANKDQSYFLAEVSQEALNHCLFPLGTIEKSKVREIAAKLQLPVAKKKDSTGICFIGERQFRAFLSNYIPKEEGDILDIDTLKHLGKHPGVMFYTYGQRKGLNISQHMGPWFVVGKDRGKNILYVGKGETNPWLFADACIVENMNWLASRTYLKASQSTQGLSCTCKLRYRQKDLPCIIKQHTENEYEVLLPEKASGVSPGQEAVFYDGEKCLGGGRIVSAYLQGRPLQERLFEHIHNLKEKQREAPKKKGGRKR